MGQSTSEPFSLTQSYRERLHRYAPKQYSAELSDDFDRATRHREQLRDDQRQIGAGAGRYVYALPELAYSGGHYDQYVLKLALPDDRRDGRDGREQNRQEATTWAATESPYLVPMVDADARGYWLVMPCGEPVSEETPGLERFLKQAHRALEGTVWEKDITPSNVVRLDGDFRLCDYGMSG